MWEELPAEVLGMLRPLSNGAIDHPRQLSAREKPDWEGYLSEMERYRELADDYDGQGAVAPPSDVIDSAISLARSFTGANVAVPTYAVAGPNGSIDLAWEYEGGVSLSVEVSAIGQAEVILFVPSD